GLTFTFGLSHTARAQEPVTISGRVVDAATNQRLPGVNVYLAHTLRGAATDIQGGYAIANVPPGSYELVASMLGYATETVQIEVMPGAPQKTINLRLAPLVYELEAVEVTAKRSRRWKYRFDQFEDLFLGASDFAKQTEIINPYVLSFEVAGLSRVLTATASAPLEIENRALGYRLRFELRQFRWDPHTEQLTLQGLPHFETLEPEDDQQARQWEENREEAFQGSLPHLFRAMIAGRTFEEGFQLQLQQPTFARPVAADDLLRKRDGAYLYELSFSGALHVSYQGSTGRGGFLRRKSWELDYWVYLGTYLGFVSEDGHVSPPRALSTSHYPKRIADLLPREYGLEPEPQQAAGETEVDLMPLAYTHMVEDERRAGQPRQEKTEAMQQALAAMRASRWNTAGRALDRILKDDPDDEEAHYYRAICAREIAKVHPFHDEEYRAVKDYRDKWTKAIDRFEGILRRDSLYRDVVYQYALLWRDALKYERAIELGHAQVRLRPELEHAHHGLFQLYRAYLNNSNKKRVAQQLAQQPGVYAAYFRGEALRKAGALPEAEAIFLRLLSDGLSMPKQPVLLSLARIDYAKEQPQQAQAYVAQAMEGIENRLEATLVFDDVKYLVSEKELDAYQALNEPEAYRSYFQAFWARRDPTPAEPINVRLAEHYRRLLLAERDYGHAGLRIWHTNPDNVGDLDFPPAYALNEEFNDKGLIYIRY
ncbi:MAG: carboxypeptidase-like regulatory domain-containing protein, partial [Rhodothermales bacterium]